MRRLDVSSQEWNLSIEKEVIENLSIEAAYAGSKQVHLSGSGYGQGLARIYLNLPAYPGFSDLRFRTDAFNGEYNSLQIKASKRFSHGLSFLASYTWSKSLGDISNDEVYLFDLGGAGVSQRDLWGRTRFDVRQVLCVSGIYELPLGRSRRFLPDLSAFPQAVLGGWKLNYILQAHTGYGFNMFTTCGVYGCYRPNLIQGRSANLPGSERTLNRWFDPTAFSAPPAGTNGNLGSNVLEGPGFSSLDMGIGKVFSTWREHRLEFRGEFFNAFNHPNFTFGDKYLVAGSDRIAGAYDGRTIQFALKYIF